MKSWKEIVYTIAAIQVGVGVAIMGVVTFIPLFVVELGVTDPGEAAFWSGLISGVTPLMIAFTTPWWTLKCEEYGHKKVLLLNLLLMAVLMAASAFARNPGDLFILRMLQGAAGGFIAIGLSLVAFVTPREHLPWAMGLFQAAMVMGITVGPLTGGVVADTLGYRMPFLVFGGLALFCLGLTAFCIHVNPPAHVKKRESLIRNFLHFMKNPVVRLMVLLQFLVNFGLTGIGPILPLYVKEMLGSSPIVATISGTLMFSAGFLSAMAAIFIGHLVKHYAMGRIFFCGTATTAVLFIVQYMMPGIWSFGFFRAVTGLSIGVIMPLANTILTMAVPPEEKNIVIGVTSSASLMGCVAGPVASGALAMHFGYGAVFWSTAAFFCIAAILIFTRKHMLPER